MVSTYKIRTKLRFKESKKNLFFNHITIFISIILWTISLSYWNIVQMYKEK